MKIYIPFPEDNFIGGPQTFMRNLKTWMSEQNIIYNNVISKGTSIFFPIAYNLKDLKKIKRNGGKVIQRLDGIYYKTKHGGEYKKKNEALKDIYLNFADYVVFQSEYSKKQCFAMLGEKQKEEYSIIKNGVNINVFYPNKSNIVADEIRFITTGNFRNSDMLEPIVCALDLLQNEYSFTLDVVGPVKEPNLKKLLDRDYINYDQGGSSEYIADKLRAADIFLYSHLNPPCPNSVLEAIASGLPVVGFNSGAMEELCSFSKELLAYVSNDIFQQYKDFDPVKLKDKILLCINNFRYYKQIAYEHNKDFSFEICGKKYCNTFSRIIERDDIINYTWKKRKYLKGINLLLNSPGKILAKQRSLSLLVQSQSKNEVGFLTDLIKKILLRKSPNESLLFLFELEKKIYQLEGFESKKFGAGEHSKHRHLLYHEWFISNIEHGERILDIGCGIGALAKDIAKGVNNVKIVGIDISESNIATAKELYSDDAISYICGDVLVDLKDDEYDTIIMSNVLEHIEKRVEFLLKIKKRIMPKKLLFRVPAYERDWRVPLMDEIGFDYRLDRTHYIEYTIDDFRNELKEAELQVESIEIKWGEFWAVAKPK